MDRNEILVLVLGTGAIAFLLWYFFGPRTAATASVSTEGIQEIKVTVKGGYSPDVISVRKSVPVRLTFFRDETASCSEQVKIPDFGILKDLPAHRNTSVEFTPDKAGEFTFTCGMNMMRGTLIVT